MNIFGLNHENILYGGEKKKKKKKSEHQQPGKIEKK
jgi:hypothetical protein